MRSSNACSTFCSSAATISSTRSAPCARASCTWYGLTMKSLRSTGMSTAARTASRSASDAAETALLGEHADRPRAARCVGLGELGGIGDRRRARPWTGWPLHLGDHADARLAQRGLRIDGAGAAAPRGLDLGEVDSCLAGGDDRLGHRRESSRELSSWLESFPSSLSIPIVIKLIGFPAEPSARARGARIVRVPESDGPSVGRAPRHRGRRSDPRPASSASHSVRSVTVRRCRPVAPAASTGVLRGCRTSTTALPLARGPPRVRTRRRAPGPRRSSAQDRRQRRHGHRGDRARGPDSSAIRGRRRPDRAPAG